MTALTDIKACVADLPPSPRGWARVLLVGVSAQRAIQAELRIRADEPVPELPKALFGVTLRHTVEFDGWAIRLCDPDGKWHDIEVL